MQVLTLLGYYAPVYGNGRAETFPYLVTYAVFAVVLVAAGAAFTRRQARL